jgi:hypothetical protein
MPSSLPPSSFPLFPNLPTEIQDQIWDILAHEQSSSLPPRIHPIARDPESWRLPGLESDVRCLPQSSTSHPEIQFRVVYRYYELPSVGRQTREEGQSIAISPRCPNGNRALLTNAPSSPDHPCGDHPTPSLFTTLFTLCRGSRDAMKRLSYCVWERQKGGYVYVNKEKDIFYFSGWGGDYWVLLKAFSRDMKQYSEEDEIARQQLMVQLQGCRNIAFDVVTSPIHACETEQVLSWLDTFRDMRSLIVVFGMRSDYRLRPNMEFWAVDDETLSKRFRMNGREFKAMVERFKEVGKELGVRVPIIEAVLGLQQGDGWSSELTLHSS